MIHSSKSGRLAGRVVLVTGAAGGIGRAIVSRFVGEEARVICADWDRAALDELHGDLSPSTPGEVTLLEHDVTDARSLIAEAAAVHGHVDVLLANAALQVMGSLETTDPEDWDRMYAVNQRAIAESIREVTPYMRAQGGGSIILTSSVLGITGDAELAMYGATKGALRALCRSVATALGPDNIRCNTICPADVETPMLRAYFDFQPDPKAARREVERHYPLGRIAQPIDIANAALFLASEESSFISGTDLIIDGGLLAKIY